jgi:hypothetical protein
VAGLDIQVAVDAHCLLARVRAQAAKDDGGQGDLLSRGKLKGTNIKRVSFSKV